MNTENKTPLFSIIVAVYNAEQYLRACIDSLLAQTVKDFEIILVNDGSKDSSGDICREYYEKHRDIITFIDGPNGGVSVAQNKGLDAARGRWISFCDSDDHISPDFCSTLLSMAEQNNAQLAGCSLLRQHTNERVSVIPLTEDVVFGKDDILNNIVHPFLRLGDPLSIQVRGYSVLCIYKREIIEKNHIRFRPGMTAAEDEAFLFEYMQYADKVAFTAKPMYFYTSNPESLCFQHLRAKRFQYHKRENNWFCRADERFRVFKEHNLKEVFPEAYPILWLELCFHQIQLLNCSRELSFFKKISGMRKLLKNMKRQPEYTLSKSVTRKKNKLFRTLCGLGFIPVFLFCKAIQLKNDLFPN